MGLKYQIQSKQPTFTLKHTNILYNSKGEREREGNNLRKGEDELGCVSGIFRSRLLQNNPIYRYKQREKGWLFELISVQSEKEKTRRDAHESRIFLILFVRIFHFVSKCAISKRPIQLLKAVDKSRLQCFILCHNSQTSIQSPPLV